MSHAPLPSKARLVFIPVFMLLALVLALSSTSGSVSARPTSAEAPDKADQSGVPTASCWLVIPSANPPTGDSRLNGVATLVTGEVWAVGSSGNQTHTDTLIEHSIGGSWDIVPSPSPGSQDNVLHGISALTPDNIWAVGSSDNQPFILHWDGTLWNVIPSPVLTDGGALMSVDAISTNDVWAVGGSGQFNSGTLVEHWTGSNWSIVPVPSGTYGLYGVDGLAPDDVWAAGILGLLHWDGTSWTYFTDDMSVGICYNPHGEYMSVSMIASNDVWAAGFCPGHAFSETAYVAHWNGTQWHVTFADTVSDGAIELNSIKALAPDDVWAVGTLPTGPAPRQVPWVEHWNGSQWNIESTIDPGGPSADFYGVAADPGGQLWAVGTYQESASSSGKTLVERYYPTCPPPPPCPGERFTDVCPGDYFYTATLALAEDGILSGYSTSPPCNNSLWIPCFKPFNNVTRGQASKVVSLAANFNDPVTGQTFEDVPPGATFYTYTERMAARQIIVGYPCGTIPAEPCVPPDNLPYFRTNNKITRGQMSKIIALSFGWTTPPGGQQFQDVPPGSTFYDYIAQLYDRNIINGYPCGGAGEPCIPPDNLPYFRPSVNVTRGQTAKIVDLARNQLTPTPTATAPPAPTSTAAPSTTPTSTLIPTVTPTSPVR